MIVANQGALHSPRTLSGGTIPSAGDVKLLLAGGWSDMSIYGRSMYREVAASFAETAAGKFNANAATIATSQPSMRFAAPTFTTYGKYLTLEWWAKETGAVSQAHALRLELPGGYTVYFDCVGTGIWGVGDASGTYGARGTFSLSTTYKHCCVQIDPTTNVVRFFVGGVPLASWAGSASSSSGNGQLYCGAENGFANALNWCFDDMRLTVSDTGCVYSSVGFTPPSAALPLTVPSTDYAWWEFETLDADDGVLDMSGQHYMRQDEFGGDSATGSYWSVVSGGKQGNRAQKITQDTGGFARGMQVGRYNPLFKPTLAVDFCFFGWVWPDSTDIKSDAYGKPVLGMAGGWVASDDYGYIQVYNNSFYAQVRKPSGTAVSVIAGAVGTIGNPHLLCFNYDATTRKIQGGVNGTLGAVSASAVAAGDWTGHLCNFALGSHRRKNRRNTDATTQDQRHLIGKWDGVGFVKGRKLSSADFTWLYNSGNGRTYAEAVAYGLFA